ncbi:MAG: alcohol dehydrogenase, partial [Proteobacteria bacterium]|nr:alcohol dehydrogenase [Pseudomonadota bacterium]MBU1582352.1 alcohol dehydrogenase [Pseudomonadota bacterium]
MFRNFKLVPNVIFGRGCFSQLDEIISKQRVNKSSWVVFVTDDVFRGKDLEKRIPAYDKDLILWVNVD